MNIINKWKPLLKFKSKYVSAVPKNEWKRVAEMLEFTESVTIGTKVKQSDIDKVITHEKKVGGHFYQIHADYSCVRNSCRAKFEVIRVRKEYKDLTIEDLFIEYI